MILSYLILAHLLGDFIFQPTKLVEWKIKKKKGIFIHSLIHFLITAILLLPFLIAGYFWLLIIIFAISFIHFFIDSTKVKYGIKNRKNGKAKPFIIDQIFHFLVIFIAYLAISDIEITFPETLFYKVYTDARVITLAYIIVFVILLIGIFRFKKKPSGHY
ncbi:DUF3307 domain-containing protein [Candidatus Peregrinibacteria bacterium]|nr:DUF3307 domain-containing protein [Candidatus Peregrinibacteria bacterium]